MISLNKKQKTRFWIILIGIIVIYFLARSGGGLPTFFQAALITTCSDSSPQTLEGLKDSFCNTTINSVTGQCSIATQDNQVSLTGQWGQGYRMQASAPPFMAGNTPFNKFSDWLTAVTTHIAEQNKSIPKLETRNGIVDVYNATEAFNDASSMAGDESEYLLFFSNNKSILATRSVAEEYLNKYISCITKDQCLNSSDECDADESCDFTDSLCKKLSCDINNKEVLESHACIVKECTLTSHCSRDIDDPKCESSDKIKQAGTCGTDYKCSYDTAKVCTAGEIKFNHYLGKYLRNWLGWENPYESRWYIFSAIGLLIIGGLYLGVKKYA